MKTNQHALFFICIARHNKKIYKYYTINIIIITLAIIIIIRLIAEILFYYLLFSLLIIFKKDCFHLTRKKNTHCANNKWLTGTKRKQKHQLYDFVFHHFHCRHCLSMEHFLFHISRNSDSKSFMRKREREFQSYPIIITTIKSKSNNFMTICIGKSLVLWTTFIIYHLLIILEMYFVYFLLALLLLGFVCVRKMNNLLF